MISSLEKTLSINPSPMFDNTSDVLEIPDPSTLDYKLPDERGDYDITAKLFYLLPLSTSLEEPSKPQTSYVSQSLYHLFRLLGIETVDNFIVHFHGLVFDGHEGEPKSAANDFDELVKVWKEIEVLQHKGRIKKSGVSEFTKNMLEELLRVVE
ncbi:1738_t:CDS:2, partial [Acaulospora colombiana]